MDIEKLMIGDWVYLNMEGHENPVRIKEIGSFCVILTDGKAYGPLLIQPIELTEEMFITNGYTRDKFGGLVSSDRRISVTSQFLNTDNKWYVHVDTEDFTSIGGCEITYVHEFQQLLRLCGIDDLKFYWEVNDNNG